jgi:2-oxoglutarate ferredoxin oxidoreductase subunit beta
VNFKHEHNIAWCPGCGNFALRDILAAALDESGLNPSEVVVVSGIGQAAKMPQYLEVNYFNGLHGRALPVATAIKAVRPELTVIAVGGDGDMYGEGGNHFIHTIRRNPGIVHLVHNNMVYGLTKGQASPTSPRGLVTPVQVRGVVNEPFNPLAVALSLKAGFVARSFSGEPDELKNLIKLAILHPGYALIDIFHPCVSFNKVNTFQWYKNNTRPLSEIGHDPADFNKALSAALVTEPLYRGLFHQNPVNPPFEQTCH